MSHFPTPVVLPRPQASLPPTLQAEYEVTPDEKRKACGRRLMQNFLSHTVSEQGWRDDGSGQSSVMRRGMTTAWAESALERLPVHQADHGHGAQEGGPGSLPVALLHPASRVAVELSSAAGPAGTPLAYSCS